MTIFDGFHERLEQPEAKSHASDRSFCVVFYAVFAISGAIKLHHHSAMAMPLLFLSVIFLAVAFIKPSLAAPLNVLWAKFGETMATITNPVLLALMYWSSIVPIGLYMRLCGKDPLHTTFDKNAASYWIARPTSDTDASMTNQF